LIGTGVMLEPVTRIAVDVVFLRMARPPERPYRQLPSGWSVTRAAMPNVALYRALYNGVGAAYCWWFRRSVSDRALEKTLRNPGLSVHVLWHGREIAGFYELDRLSSGEINLGYFGLLPHAVGKGVGKAFLDHAVETAWGERPRAVRVNTCTADHPRALPTYLGAGFEHLQTVREVWEIPDRLGMTIPEELRVF